MTQTVAQSIRRWSASLSTKARRHGGAGHAPPSRQSAAGLHQQFAPFKLARQCALVARGAGIEPSKPAVCTDQSIVILLGFAKAGNAGGLGVILETSSQLSPKALDGHGNYSFGITEQAVFPEIHPDSVKTQQGMHVTIVTTAETDDEGRELLRQFGFPFAEAEEE